MAFETELYYADAHAYDISVIRCFHGCRKVICRAVCFPKLEKKISPRNFFFSLQKKTENALLERVLNRKKHFWSLGWINS